MRGSRNHIGQSLSIWPIRSTSNYISERVTRGVFPWDYRELVLSIIGGDALSGHKSRT